MKKTLSLILALLMSVSSASLIFADEEVEATAAIADEAVVEEEETVVEDATEYDLAIQFLQSYNIMHGKEDGLHVEDEVKRYEMALFTGRVSTGWVQDSEWEDGIANDSQFTDLAGSGAENVLGALSYVNQKGIIEGYPDGSFKPEQTVSYREALTMAVRTLGFTGLDYPWEYIEKAVALGLTNGISGVAYTEQINRGVAAQIVYNMLFAKTSAGDTLAMRSFDVDFGWQNILITADDKAAYEAKTTGTNKDNGIVSFKLLNNDGTLDSTTYYVKGEYEVGKVYNALFALDSDEELVNMYGAYPYVANVVENKGLTDDEGEEYEVADVIGAYLKDYTLVEKYNVKNLSKDSFYNNEIIVKQGTGSVTVFEGTYDWYNNSLYAFDWTTGDILKRVYNEDETEFVYEVEWKYNADFDMYYRYAITIENFDDLDNDKYDADKLADKFVGLDILDEKDVAEIKKAAVEAAKVYGTYTAYQTVLEYAKTAYATLEAYDLTGDGMDDYGIYEAYTFGTLEATDDDYCSKCDDANGVKLSGNLYTLEGTCDHTKITGECYLDTYTFVEGFEPTTDEDGEYVYKYVIYGVNESTNEIKVVKEIGDGSDVDSYVATGVVRGYSLNKKTITIGDTKYEYNYSTLNGANYFDGDHKAENTATMDTLFNQFVEFVVVDGKIVRIATVGDTKENYIVVERYLGIDSDNYIVVEGYTTDALKRETFRIGAFDGWKKGDFFFYEDQISIEFDKGSVYQITSVDTTAENGDVYYVTCIGNANTNNQVEGDFVHEDATVAPQDNYRVITVDGKAVSTKKMNKDQKYVVIGDYKNYLVNYMPIFFYEGKIPTGWTVTGDILVEKDDLIIIANPSNMVGFSYDSVKTGYVAIVDKKITDRNYNGYGEDYYIYGAVEYTVEAFNLLTMKTDSVVVGTNIDVKAGRVYTTIDNGIVDDNGYDFAAFMKDVQFAYYDKVAETADYLFAKINITNKDYLGNDDDAEHNLSNDVISGLVFTSGHSYKDLTDNGVEVREVVLDKNGYVSEINDFGDKEFDKLAKDFDKVEIPAFVIYDVDAEKSYVYVLTGDAVTAVLNSVSVDADNYLEVTTEDGDSANILASLTVNYGEKDGKATAEITTIDLAWDGVLTTDTHEAIEANGFCFGVEDDCQKENWKTTVDEVRIPGSIDADLYDNCTNDVCEDKLVKSISIVLNKPVAVTGTEDAEQKVVVTFSDSFGTRYSFAIDVALNAKGEVETWFCNGDAGDGTDVQSIGRSVTIKTVLAK